MLSIYCFCRTRWLIVPNTLKRKHHVVNKHSLTILSCLFFFLLALLLLCPRCKYLAGAELARLAAVQPHVASGQGLSHRLFHGCSPLLPTHHTVSCCCFLACLFRATIRGFQYFWLKGPFLYSRLSFSSA